jgi:predicted short-subunit dehydrogenase-like oxidoreductase (DUF2520 family)
MALTLNIVGCGRVGRTLARLWHGHGVFAIGDVDDRTSAKSADAVAAIGAGRAVGGIAGMRRADCWMITTRDDAIAACASALASSGHLSAGNVVFHCSGTLASSDLGPVAAKGAVAASVHPLKTFAGAGTERDLDGVFCAAEGDADALVVLRPAFERLGATVSDIDPRFKTIYHAAGVMVCNYLVTLIEAGAACYQKAGYAQADALHVMEPLVRETLDNVFKLGTVRALTGPIARGDAQVVARHIEALRGWNPQLAALYTDLGNATIELARKKGDASVAALAEIERMLVSGKK